MIEFTAAGTPVSGAGITAAARTIGCDAPSLWALLAVETAGCGYQVDRRPKILFERHIFHRLTNGRFDVAHPDISAAVPGGYGAGGAHQYARLHEAMELDENAALSSASWGLGQILGTNFRKAGFGNVADMVKAFVANEDNQLDGMVRFIAASGLARAVVDKHWAVYARGYNGADFARNRYDERLQAACAEFTARGTPNVVLRGCQVFLNYLGFSTGGIDGLKGKLTIAALKAFQKSAGMAETGNADDATFAALRRKVEHG